MGRVSLVGSTSSGVSGYILNTAFGKTTNASASLCAHSVMGACTVVTCPNTPDDAGTPMAITTPNAGDVTVTNAMGDAGALVATYGAVRGVMAYPSLDAAIKFFSGGDMITATGAGGADLPAFGAQTVVAPSDITVPACTSMCPDVDRSKDLIVTWTGGGAGNVDVFLQARSDTGPFIAIACRYAASAGTATVPTAVLSLPVPRCGRS